MRPRRVQQGLYGYSKTYTGTARPIRVQQGQYGYSMAGYGYSMAGYRYSMARYTMARYTMARATLHDATLGTPAYSTGAPHGPAMEPSHRGSHSTVHCDSYWIPIYHLPLVNLKRILTHY